LLQRYGADSMNRHKKLAIVVGLVLAAVVLLSVLRSVRASHTRDRQEAMRELDERLTRGIAAQEHDTGSGSGESTGIPEASFQGTILNADQFRREITMIDRLVFENEPLGETRRELLAAKLEELATVVKSASDTRFLEIESAELKNLAAYAQSYPENTPRTNLENQWMRIRNNVFDDRSWFARSAADLEPLPSASRADPFKPAVPSEGVNEPARTLPPAPVLVTHELEGRWRVRELYGNGRLMTDPEISNSIWAFHGDQMTIESRFKSPSSYTFTKIEDDRGTALRLESNRANRGPDERGWMSYSFGDGDLKVAFYDGLGARPEGFTAVAGKADPMLTVVILQRSSEGSSF
jgi:uncharacterized protein (TIGR03067 family)